MKQQARDYFKSLQNQITEVLSTINQKGFTQDIWTRDEGGGGDTRVYEDGVFLEKGGVNFSEVFGEFSPEFAKSLPAGEGLKFYATGISLVLHPKNPFAPTVHANYRYLERGGHGWFGGGADLTPCYFFLDDAIHFHQTYFNVLAPFGQDTYSRFKKNCDEYFYLPHRKETRGVGGIFFDYQSHTNMDSVFDMVQACGNSFLDSYMPIVQRRMNLPFTDANKNFQEFRRGRYVEFNLVYDRGTTFGLKTNGRIESILMSLPKHAQWLYNYRPQEGSAEGEIYKYLKPIDWLDIQ